MLWNTSKVQIERGIQLFPHNISLIIRPNHMLWNTSKVQKEMGIQLFSPQYLSYYSTYPYLTGVAKYDFDLLVRFFKMLFCTGLYDSYIVNPYKISLVRAGSGTSWAIRTMDFATPAYDVGTQWDNSFEYGSHNIGLPDKIRCFEQAKRSLSRAPVLTLSSQGVHISLIQTRIHHNLISKRAITL